MASWAPFNSVIDGNILAEEVLKEKNKITKPILSDEQIKNIERLIWESFTSNINLEFTIYHNGYLYTYQGAVIKIIKEQQKIILNNKKIIYFCQIIDVKVRN